MIIPPSFSAVISGEGLEISSPSLKGREMNAYADEVGFRCAVKSFGGLSAVRDMWKVLNGTENSFIKNLRAKGIVLYTISEIYSSLYASEKTVSDSIAYRVKEYIDDNVTNMIFSFFRCYLFVSSQLNTK